jgi:hypothetical protein
VNDGEVHRLFTPVQAAIAHDVYMEQQQRGFVWRIVLLFASVVGCVLVAGTSSAAGQVEARPDLTGTGVLNRELSGPAGNTGSPGEEGRPSPRGGGRGRPGMGGPGGMGGRSGGFGGPGGGEMPDREEMERARAAMDAVMRMSPRLIIVTAEKGYLLTDDEGVSMRIPVEGTKDTGAVNGAPFETTTKWQGGKLRVERKFKSGLKVTDYYAVAGEPRVLTVSQTIEGGRMPGGTRPLNRVYNLEPR